MKALAFLAGDEETLRRFLAISGLYPEDLRERLDDPVLLGGVLDFLLADDKLLVAFAQEQALDPKLLQAARHALPGATPEF